MSTERGPGIEYGDADILNHTKKKIHDRQGRFKFVAAIPPSGRLFESEWIHPDNVKKGLASSWCEAVRDQIDADWAENRKKIEENKQSRTADPIRTKETIVAEDQKIEIEGTIVGVVNDPEQFVRSVRDRARAELDIVHRQYQEAHERLVDAKKNVKTWEAVALSLNLGEKEDDKPEESGTDSDDSDSGSVHTDLGTERIHGD